MNDEKDINIASVDFSEAHFLDHSLWECLRNPTGPNRFGGLRQHVRYAWEFRWGPELARLLLCPLGHHGAAERGMRDDVNEPFTYDIGCRNCGRHLGDLSDDDR